LCSEITAVGYWPARTLTGKGYLYYDTFSSLSMVVAISFWLMAILCAGISQGLLANSASLRRILPYLIEPSGMPTRPTLRDGH
jgi:hypothetical protein